MHRCDHVSDMSATESSPTSSERESVWHGETQTPNSPSSVTCSTPCLLDSLNFCLRLLGSHTLPFSDKSVNFQLVNELFWLSSPATTLESWRTFGRWHVADMVAPMHLGWRQRPLEANVDGVFHDFGVHFSVSLLTILLLLNILTFCDRNYAVVSGATA